jgi:hypothetical protein
MKVLLVWRVLAEKAKQRGHDEIKVCIQSVSNALASQLLLTSIAVVPASWSAMVHTRPIAVKDVLTS